MAKKNTNKTFFVNARIVLDTTVQVPARDLAEALTKSTELSMESFINIKGDHNDSSLKITGIFSDYEPV